MSCVNAVGVDVNTASASLLAYVSGIGPALAANIVKYRTENGSFATRNDLKKVPRLGAKAVFVLWRQHLLQSRPCQEIRAGLFQTRNILKRHPRLKGRRILALDPGYRTGCKTVAIDEKGDLLDDAVIYPIFAKRDTDER